MYFHELNYQKECEVNQLTNLRIEFPKDIIQSIHQYLTPKKIAENSRVCKIFYNALNDAAMKTKLIESQLKMLDCKEKKQLFEMGSLFTIDFVIEQCVQFSSNLSSRFSKMTLPLLLPPTPNQKTRNIKSAVLRYRDSEEGIFTTPCSLGGGFFANGSDDGTIYVKQITEKGELRECARHKTASCFDTAPCSIGKDFFVIISMGGTIYLMQATEKGDLVERAICEMGVEFEGVPPLSLGGGLFIVESCCQKKFLMKVNEKGELKKCAQLDCAAFSEKYLSIACPLGGRFFVFCSDDGNIYLMQITEKEDFKLCAKHKMEKNNYIGESSPCLLGGGYFAIQISDGICLMHATEKGELRECANYIIKMDEVIVYSLCSLGGGLFTFGTREGTVYLMRATEKEEIVECDIYNTVGDTISSTPCSLGGGLFVVGFSNYRTKLIQQQMIGLSLLQASEKGELKQLAMENRLVNGAYTDFCLIGDGSFIFTTRDKTVLMQVSEEDKTKKRKRD